MHLDNTHFAEVEILSFESHCKLDGMSYEQTVAVKTDGGTLIRLFDFMGFAVTESRLGKGKKLILCVPAIEGEIAVLESATPGVLDSDFEPANVAPSKVTLVAKVLDVNEADHDLLVDAGFGQLYVIPHENVSRFNAGDIIKFKADRVDLLEILE
ncbi:MAG: hypothetical protein HY801_16645 [Candidatus Lindowbacteria bacterium]|nr:hypothetical protein [Candidatus Lindowbacteria bacterium]